jgi:hypothetical protein
MPQKVILNGFIVSALLPLGKQCKHMLGLPLNALWER